MKWTAISSSWNSSTARTCNGWSNSTARWISTSAADYIRQAAEGLAHAHARNLVHCDIKPSNLLVNNQGVIKILDLGLARLNRSDEPRGAAAGEPAFGTVDYMAPEQALETREFRSPRRHLFPGLHALLPAHRASAFSGRHARPADRQAPDAGTPRHSSRAARHAAEAGRYLQADDGQGAGKSLPIDAGGERGPGALAERVGRREQAAAPPQAVKPLDDAASAAAPADDWLSFLAGPSKSDRDLQRREDACLRPQAAAKPTKSGKQQGERASPAAESPQPLAGVLAFGRAKLGWFNTPKRKIVGAVGGTALLAAVAGLASLPFLLSHPKPAPQAAVSSHKPRGKEDGVVEEDVGPPPDKSTARKSRMHPTNRRESTPEEPSPGSQAFRDKPQKSDRRSRPSPTSLAAQAGEQAQRPGSETSRDATPAPRSRMSSQPARKRTKPPKPPPAKPVSWMASRWRSTCRRRARHADEAVSLGKLDLDPKLTSTFSCSAATPSPKAIPSSSCRKTATAQHRAGRSRWPGRTKTP